MENGTSFLWIRPLLSIYCYIQLIYYPTWHSSCSLQLYQILQLPHHDNCNMFLCQNCIETSCLICSLPWGRITCTFVTSARSHSLFELLYPRALLSIPHRKIFPSPVTTSCYSLGSVCSLAIRHSVSSLQQMHICISRLLCSHIFFFRLLQPITSNVTEVPYLKPPAPSLGRRYFKELSGHWCVAAHHKWTSSIQMLYILTKTW